MSITIAQRNKYRKYFKKYAFLALSGIALLSIINSSTADFVSTEGFNVSAAKTNQIESTVDISSSSSANSTDYTKIAY